MRAAAVAEVSRVLKCLGSISVSLRAPFEDLSVSVTVWEKQCEPDGGELIFVWLSE